jgi:hypothetical protein
MELKNVVKFFIFLIVIVFDPFAVALIIAFNGLISQKKKEQKEHIVEIMQNDEELGLYDNLDDLMEENYKGYEVYGDNIVNENEKNEINEKKEDTNVESTDVVVNDTPTSENVEEKLPDLKWEEYMHPEFPWNKRNLWINNPKAVNYWLSTKGGNVRELSRLRSEDENIKTY